MFIYKNINIFIFNKIYTNINLVVEVAKQITDELEDPVYTDRNYWKASPRFNIDDIISELHS